MADQKTPVETSDEPVDPRVPKAIADELAAARARAVERDAKAAAKRAEQRALAELQALKAAELADKLGAEHGGSFVILDEDDGELPQDTIGAIYLVPGSPHMVAIKRGPGVLWHKYTASKMTSEHDEKLVLGCLAHPSREEVSRIIAERPAALPRLTLAIGKLYGFKLENDRKK